MSGAYETVEAKYPDQLSKKVDEIIKEANQKGLTVIDGKSVPEWDPDRQLWVIHIHFTS